MGPCCSPLSDPGGVRCFGGLPLEKRGLLLLCSTRNMPGILFPTMRLLKEALGYRLPERASKTHGHIVCHAPHFGALQVAPAARRAPAAEGRGSMRAAAEAGERLTWLVYCFLLNGLFFLRGLTLILCWRGFRSWTRSVKAFVNIAVLKRLTGNQRPSTPATTVRSLYAAMQNLSIFNRSPSIFVCKLHEV